MTRSLADAAAKFWNAARQPIGKKAAPQRPDDALELEAPAVPAAVTAVAVADRPEDLWQDEPVQHEVAPERSRVEEIWAAMEAEERGEEPVEPEPRHPRPVLPASFVFTSKRSFGLRRRQSVGVGR